MSKQTIFVTLCVCATAIIISAIHAVAGPLNPPAGAVAPTPGPESRIAVNAVNTPGDDDATPSLFKITQPGSYYLEGSITGVAGRHGIEIDADGVTLDLNGFELLGVPGSFNGVAVTGGASNLSIHSGSVRAWGQDGVNAIFAGNSTLRNLVLSDNGQDGLIVGQGGVVEGCAARDNGGDGIVVGLGSTVSGCTANENTGNGISTSIGSVVIGCTALGNGRDGVSAFSSTVSGCVSSVNGRHGVVVGSGGVARDNMCLSNGGGAGVTDGAGVLLTGPGARAENNTVTSNDVGVSSSGEGFIVGNSAFSNATAYVFQPSDAIGIIFDLSVAGPIPLNASPWSNFIH